MFKINWCGGNGLCLIGEYFQLETIQECAEDEAEEGEDESEEEEEAEDQREEEKDESEEEQLRVMRPGRFSSSLVLVRLPVTLVLIV